MYKQTFFMVVIEISIQNINVTIYTFYKYLKIRISIKYSSDNLNKLLISCCKKIKCIYLSINKFIYNIYSGAFYIFGGEILKNITVDT